MSNRWEPALREADTLELARSDDDRIEVTGRGAAIETEVKVVTRGLHSLAIAAIRFGQIDQVTWHVDGRTLELAPVTAAAAPVVSAEDVRDLGALVARLAIEQLGGSVALDGETLRVEL